MHQSIMGFSYHAENWLPHPAVRVFDFFANPANLPLLMPAWQRLRLEEASILPPPRRPGESGAATVAAGVGSRFTFSFRPLPLSPVRVRWESEITEFTWNDHFCDRQIRGPFVYWEHRHSIRPASWHEIDATFVVDDVEYELPLGSIGSLAHHLFVRGQIERVFAYRQSRLKKLLASIKSQSLQSQPDWADPAGPASPQVRTPRTP
jgi:ligand-binding SRPBCC domain-containing protein